MTLTSLLDRLAPVVYPALRESYRPDCCIAAAAILTRVFEERGYSALPVPVTVEIYNAAMAKLLLHRRQLPSDPERKRLLLDITGAWSVGIVPSDYPVESPMRDARRPGHGYGGHMLLRVENYLVDATIKQAERPEKKIVLPEMLVTKHADKLLSGGSLFLEVGDCQLVYRTLNDESYLTAPDWTRRDAPYPQTVNKILQRIGRCEKARITKNG